MKIKYSTKQTPPSFDKKEIHRFLLDISAAASQVTLKYFRKTIDVENKEHDGFDPVTIADKQAEQIIREKIAEKFPDHGIIGEEWDTKVTDSPYSWVIDPIDGTRAFISGLPVWGTLVALCYDGYPIAGLMSQPHIGEDFVCAGDGAFLHRNVGEKIALKTSDIQSLSKATMFTTSPRIFLNEKSLTTYNKLEAQTRLARYGLDCYGYAMVAAGYGELVVEEGLKDVDVAALVPLIEGAGGTVTTWSGKPVTNGGQVVAAANAQLHEQALEILSTAATD